MVPKNIVRIMLLVSFVLASACGRQLAPLDFTQPSRSQLLITSTSGLERSIHLHSYIYQPIDANEATDDDNLYKRDLVRTVVVRALEKSIIRS